MSDKNLVNAGSAESRNFDREFVAVVARRYCDVSMVCLSDGVGFNGDGLLWKRLCRSSTVRVGVSELWRDLVVGVFVEHGEGDRGVRGGDLGSGCG